MTKTEHASALRNDPNTHYNCAQSVLIPFAEELSIQRETANALADHFGGGMGCGSVCGALTGALMAMGGLKLPKETQQELLAAFRAEFGDLNCAALTDGLEPGTPERKYLCDKLVAWCAAFTAEAAGLN